MLLGGDKLAVAAEGTGKDRDAAVRAAIEEALAQLEKVKRNPCAVVVPADN